MCLCITSCYSPALTGEYSRNLRLWKVTESTSIGRLANLSFPIWDPLLKRLSMRQSGFLHMLSYEMLKQLITTPDADPLVDKSEESVVMWLEHIYTAREWDKAFTHGDLDDLNLVSTCLQTPNQWTTRLAESIIKCPERVRAQQMFGERVAKAVDGKKNGEALKENDDHWVAMKGEHVFDGWQRLEVGRSRNPVGVLWKRWSNDERMPT